MLIETDITYISTNNGMTYLMCIKDVFSKEWYGYNYNTSCTARDAINAVDDSTIRKFNGNIPDNITLRSDNCKRRLIFVHFRRNKIDPYRQFNFDPCVLQSSGQNCMVLRCGE